LKKEEYDRQQRAKIAAAKGGTRVSHIDAEGIAKGVVGGSAENKVGGAGGKALTADGAVTERYFALLKEKVRNAIDKPPGVSDELSVTIVVHISASGRLSGAHVTRSSGNEEWDRAVIAAFGRVSMPEHPEHKGEDLELEFRTKDADG
jgi:colicin import membrane protein